MKDHWIHIVCFFVIVLFVSIASIYQGIIHSSGAPFSPKELFQLRTWKEIARAVHDRKGVTLDEYVALIDGQVYTIQRNEKNEQTRIGTPPKPIHDRKIVTAPNGDTIAYLAQQNEQSKQSEVCILSSTIGRQTFCSSFVVDHPESLQIIHWSEDGKTLYLAVRSGRWSIWSIDAQTTEKKELLKDIYFPQQVLTLSYEPLSNYLLYPVCQESLRCWFEYYDLHTGKVVGQIPAIRDEHEGEHLPTLQFAFFSPSTHMIGYYQLTAEGIPFRMFTIQHNGEGDDKRPLLIQSIRLDANPNLPLRFVHYYSINKTMLFEGLHKEKENKQIKELFLYSAVKPSLRMLGIFPAQEILRPLNRANLYAHGHILQSTVRNIKTTPPSSFEVLEAR